MHFSFKLILLLLTIVLDNGLCRRYFEDDFCILTSSGATGICKLISSCPSAIESLKQGIYPTNCGFLNNEPIVCCAPGTIDDDLSTTKRVQTNPSTTTPNVDKSKQKCQEYGKYYKDAENITILPNTMSQVAFCPITGVAHNTIGAVPALLKEFPHMALIGFVRDDNTTHWDCSGSLISEKFVLSAAHCAYHRQYHEAKHILLGELVLDSTTDDANLQNILIKNIIRHPKYLPLSSYHDIALFELEHNAILNTYTRPACLYTNPNLTSTKSIVSGWGKFSRFGDVSKHMQSVSLNILPNTECNNSYDKSFGRALANGIVEEIQFCAGSKNALKDNCQGDSGGPIQIINHQDVYCTYKIIGITSLEKPCGSVNYPGIYTRVSAYIKWIEDIVWP